MRWPTLCPFKERPVPEICKDFTFETKKGDRELLVYDGELCKNNVLDAARKDNNFKTFVDLIELAGLDDIFLCSGPFTAMIPTNDAFNKLNASLLESLTDPANLDQLKDILLYHMLPGYHPTMDLVPGPLKTIQGEDVQFSANPFMFNDATVIMPDYLACNGIFDSIDEVLVPPSMAARK